MMTRQHYTGITRSPDEVRVLQDAFFRKAGPVARLMAELFETMPHIAFVLKDAQGHIVHTNRYNAQVSGWQSPADMIGYTSYELYPPDQAAVYGGRDHEVLETGVPIVGASTASSPTARPRSTASRYVPSPTRADAASAPPPSTGARRASSARRTGTSPSGRPLSIWTGISPSTSPLNSLPGCPATRWRSSAGSSGN